MYKKIIKRNLFIFINDKVGIMFSFLGMFISLFIYIFFLRSNLIASLSGIYKIERFIDTWMIAGLISIVATTSTLSAFGQKLEDEKNMKLNDFIVNGKLTSGKINYLYIGTSIIEGFISTLIFSLVCFGYLSLKYHYNAFDMNFFILIIFVTILIIFSSLMFSLITAFLKTASSFSSLSAIVGTLTGFFSGTYITYGELPNFMQNILKFWPGYQIAAIARNEMIKSINIKISNQVINLLGISSDWKYAIILTIITGLIVGIVTVLKFKK